MPPWPVRLVVAVHAMTGAAHDYILTRMPLRLAFSYEHAYYCGEGYICSRIGAAPSFDD